MKDNISEDYIANFSKQVLENVKFKGIYSGKRYAPALKSTRDVVLIDKKETQFINDLYVVRNRLQAFYPQDYHIGFGDEPTNQLLTENLNVLRGTYIFTVEAVEFRKTEIILKLKIINRIYNVHTLWYFFISVIFTVLLVIWICSAFLIKLLVSITNRLASCLCGLVGKVICKVQQWF